MSPFLRRLLLRRAHLISNFDSLVCVFTLDVIGRRMTLFWGGGVQAFALIMAGVFVHLLTIHPEKTAQFGGAATFMVFLYTATLYVTGFTSQLAINDTDLR